MAKAIQCDRCRGYESGDGHEITSPTTFPLALVICNKCWGAYQKWVKREA